MPEFMQLSGAGTFGQILMAQLRFGEESKNLTETFQNMVKLTVFPSLAKREPCLLQCRW